MGKEKTKALAKKRKLNEELDGVDKKRRALLKDIEAAEDVCNKQIENCARWFDSIYIDGFMHLPATAAYPVLEALGVEIVSSTTTEASRSGNKLGAIFKLASKAQCDWLCQEIKEMDVGADIND